MKIRFDVRLAVVEANAVFRQFPLQMCLPMVFMAVLAEALFARQHLGKHAGWLVPMVAFLAYFFIACVAEIATSILYLDVRGGGKPRMEALAETLRCRGLVSLLMQYFARFLGWVFVAAILFFVGYVAVDASVIAIRTILLGGRANGVSGAAVGFRLHGWSSAPLFGTIVALLFYRYVFVLPLFAIERGAGRGFLNKCVAHAKRVRRAAVLVCLSEVVPVVLASHLRSTDMIHSAGSRWISLGVPAAVNILVSCYSAWFILVRTGLAMQLIALPETPPDAMELRIPD